MDFETCLNQLALSAGLLATTKSWTVNHQGLKVFVNIEFVKNVPFCKPTICAMDTMKIKLYKKKSPSQLRRDQARRIKYQQNRLPQCYTPDQHPSDTVLNVDARPFKPSPSSEEHFQVEPKDTINIDSEDYDLPFTQCDSDEISNLSDNLDVLRTDLKQTKSHLQLVKNEFKSLQHTTANEHICNNCADLSKELQASNIQNQTMKDEEDNHLCEIRDLREQLEEMSGSRRRHALQQQSARPVHAARQPDFHNPQQAKYHRQRRDYKLTQWALPPPQQFGYNSRKQPRRHMKTRPPDTDCCQTNASLLDTKEFQQEMQNLKQDIQKFTKYYHDNHY